MHYLETSRLHYLSNRALELYTNLTERLGFPIASTDRSAESYRKNLFPDLASEKELLEFLRGKLVIDIGSGRTHLNPYSLINLTARQKEFGITLLGIDPMAVTLSSASNSSRKDTPGHGNAIAAEAARLPITQDKVDIILSSYFVGYWKNRQGDMLDMFKEFDRVLAEDGEIRLYPTACTAYTKDNKLGDFIKNKFIMNCNNSKFGFVSFRRKL